MANLVMLTALSQLIALRGTGLGERGNRTCSSQAMG
jgi:hypothetical protein